MPHTSVGSFVFVRGVSEFTASGFPVTIVPDTKTVALQHRLQFPCDDAVLAVPDVSPIAGEYARVHRES